MRPPAPSARLSHQLRRQSCTYHTRDRPPGKASEPVLDELKFLADSATITIEPKHLDPFVVCDRRNFIALTNHDDVFSVNLESTTFTATLRKFFAIRANDCYSTEHRQADAELDAEAHEYFSILNAAALERAGARERDVHLAALEDTPGSGMSPRISPYLPPGLVPPSKPRPSDTSTRSRVMP